MIPSTSPQTTSRNLNEHTLCIAVSCCRPSLRWWRLVDGQPQTWFAPGWRFNPRIGRQRTKRILATSGSAGQQLLGTLAVIVAVIAATFLVTRVFSPDPVSLFVGGASNGFVSPEQAAQARATVSKRLGLDEPIPVQFYNFTVQLLHGDLGISFQTGQSPKGLLAA